MKLRRHITALPLMLLLSATGWAAAPIVVGQVHRAFTVKQVTIHRGDTIRFSNTDEFIHHLYVHSPTYTFNSGEQAPGHDVEIQFPVSGTFDVRCEIHPRMQLGVTVD